MVSFYMSSLLSQIHSPDDLRKLSSEELLALPQEIRDTLIRTIAANGGHLAPNLGTVELTIAIHSVFHAPEDKILWDVGHQSYTHKLITGRADRFDTLRQKGGLCGFTRRGESPYDCFGSGHAGTALSAAMGFQAASELHHHHEHVVAVVGDGALGCGITFEALNNLRNSCKSMILIVNDNKMSIARNTGAVSCILSRILIGRYYNGVKRRAKGLLGRSSLGRRIIRHIQSIENSLKSFFVPGMFFEEMGLRYVGPVNGHDIPALIRTLRGVKMQNIPVVIHVVTEKGHGYPFAEKDPEVFHGIGRFDPKTGKSLSKSASPSFSQVFGESLAKETARRPSVVSICAAMALGCGIPESYIREYRDRYFDVGISEEHAIAFAGGLAANGCLPVAVIYATFVHRALDCIFHDICLQNVPMLLCEDRCGLVEDGPTHHGIYDLSFLIAMPNLVIMMPASESELPMMMSAALDSCKPCVIRYPKGNSGCPSDFVPSPLKWGKSEVVREGADLSIWCAGRETWTGVAVAEIMEKQYGIQCAVVNVRFLKPFDSDLLKQYAHAPVVTIEDHVKQGGLASIVAGLLAPLENCPRLISFGWEADEIIPHGNTAKIREERGMIPPAIAASIAKSLSL